MAKSLPQGDAPDRPPVPRELELLARWMDSAFRIPGLGWRFGWDVILGLFPGAGDLATSLVSIYIFSAAQRYGVPRITILRMALNIVIDVALGAIPFVGDAFDVYWKSNQRNVELLRRHVGVAPFAARKLRTSDRLFVAAIAVGLLLLVVASLMLAYYFIAWFVAVLHQVTA